MQKIEGIPGSQRERHAVCPGVKLSEAQDFMGSCTGRRFSQPPSKATPAIPHQECSGSCPFLFGVHHRLHGPLGI